MDELKMAGMERDARNPPLRRLLGVILSVTKDRVPDG
jgi:hypothetical protein